MDAMPQLSVTFVGSNSLYCAVYLQLFVADLVWGLLGQVPITGALLSVIVTLYEQMLLFPLASVAFQLTVVIPLSNTLPTSVLPVPVVAPVSTKVIEVDGNGNTPGPGQLSVAAAFQVGSTFVNVHDPATVNLL